MLYPKPCNKDLIEIFVLKHNRKEFDRLYENLKNQCLYNYSQLILKDEVNNPEAITSIQLNNPLNVPLSVPILHVENRERFELGKESGWRVVNIVTTFDKIKEECKLEEIMLGRLLEIVSCVNKDYKALGLTVEEDLEFD